MNAGTGLLPRIRDDLHRRVELVPMDGQAGDITVTLYLLADERTAVVHSYASTDAAAERTAWLASAMRILADMAGEGVAVSFACGRWHEKAARRAFLDAAKLDPSQPVSPRPLGMHDPRTNQEVSVEALGAGAYRVTSIAADPATPSRAPAVVAGFVKLAEVEADSDDETLVRFGCGSDHHALMGLLLPRAINVRSALREQELAASRGILVAPSAQQQASDG